VFSIDTDAHAPGQLESGLRTAPSRSGRGVSPSTSRPSYTLAGEQLREWGCVMRLDSLGLHAMSATVSLPPRFSLCVSDINESVSQDSSFI